MDVLVTWSVAVSVDVGITVLVDIGDVIVGVIACGELVLVCWLHPTKTAKRKKENLKDKLRIFILFTLYRFLVCKAVNIKRYCPSIPVSTARIA
jgi:hypothetical protein